MPATFTEKSMRMERTTLITLLTMLWLGSCGYVDSPFDDREFNSEEWIASWAEDKGHMTHDLIEGHLPVGMLDSQVLELLGNPGETRLQGEIGNWVPSDSAKTFIYYIGSWGFGVHGDDSYLYIQFDKESKLLRAEIVGL